MFSFDLHYNSKEYQDAMEAYESGNYKIARNYYENQAEKGSLEAQYYLGYMYLLGHGIEPGPGKIMEYTQKGIELIENSANSGYPDSLGMLAAFYERGELGFPLDLNKSIELRIKAAETKDGLAANNLGVIYFEGKIVPQDYLEASMVFNWCSR